MLIRNTFHTAKTVLGSKQMPWFGLISFRSRLNQLAHITFANYLSKSLASRGNGAALVAFALIITRVLPPTRMALTEMEMGLAVRVRGLAQRKVFLYAYSTF